MMRPLACLFAILIPGAAYGQADSALVQRVTELERRIEKLEAENHRMRAALSVLHYIHDAKDGQRVTITEGDRTVATLLVANRGWGASRPEDVAAVVKSVAGIVFAALPPRDVPTIIVQRSPNGPRALSNRGPNNEYIVLLNTGDRLWAQLSYQLAHELGHVVCRELSERAPQQWFEEAFCEALSIWTLQQMGHTWQTEPPYASWASYAPSLAKYAADVHAKAEQPNNFRGWYAEHRDRLNRDSYDRDANRVVAAHMVNRANARPEYLRAFLYLRSTPLAANSMESLIEAWHSSCPDDLKFVPIDVAKVLGIKPPG